MANKTYTREKYKDLLDGAFENIAVFLERAKKRNNEKDFEGVFDMLKTIELLAESIVSAFSKLEIEESLETQKDTLDTDTETTTPNAESSDPFLAENLYSYYATELSNIKENQQILLKNPEEWEQILAKQKIIDSLEDIALMAAYDNYALSLRGGCNDTRENPSV